MKVEIVNITPSMASDLLKLNIGNRPLNMGRVRELAARMAAGQWRSNGDAVRVGTTRLLDGQHRLSAIVMSGVTVESVLVQGLKDEVFVTIDDGRARTASDVFSVMGECNAALLAAATKFVTTYNDGSQMDKIRVSKEQLIETLRQHPGLRSAVTKVHAITHKVNLIPESILTGCYYLFTLVNRDLADAFLEGVAKGTGVPPGSAALVLRERMISNLASRSKLPRIDTAALVIKAWNAELRGKTVKQLKWSIDEGFPVIAGLTPNTSPKLEPAHA